ncbi:hypothetical protein [Ruegeria atlantica]|uniref:hypothetical protein n=1 Tax=Ruegeria atlantica TaxID=81569 RepID=UPI001F36F89A|nr:hypothetical protein [Ruegeria atlantica]
MPNPRNSLTALTFQLGEGQPSTMATGFSYLMVRGYARLAGSLVFDEIVRGSPFISTEAPKPIADRM